MGVLVWVFGGLLRGGRSVFLCFMNSLGREVLMGCLLRVRRGGWKLMDFNGVGFC